MPVIIKYFSTSGCIGQSGAGRGATMILRAGNSLIQQSRRMFLGKFWRFFRACEGTVLPITKLPNLRQMLFHEFLDGEWLFAFL
jgi:hypothetical protein